MLSEIAAVTESDYRHRVIWHAPGVDPAVWSDPDAVYKVMERSHTPDTGARGLVHGHLDETDNPAIVDILWRAGVDGRVLDCTARFNPRGGARSLARHDPEWLVALLGNTVDAAGGNVGRIVTSSWLAEDERRMRDGVSATGMVPFWLGEVTFVPAAIDPAGLPDTLTAHPWNTVRGAGTIVRLRDLAATIVDPTTAVDDMLQVRRHLPDS